ncbi:uracil-DNA glycosylase [Bordetella holmesii]|uniref:uracil-DNA glycosylase n=1 Tax=Bordetella holmesii TaxID=35814 RepID=UPI0002BB294F|nr:uracil-DNA glycosylase [Bordetella holmesii]AMD47316.1 DNA polymerase [Bordetella holmesii H558]AOB34707.1 uracil-DNA glycosylase [Bordetella holmesii]AUL21205.1 uracil-DNA glycosylase [Bordetella holmesii]AUL22034.1 uracil-DNA glycosylase [Bordetella holmesii]AUL27874.1 uracil-DNA glycosylase [Bordetella holmesii]
MAAVRVNPLQRLWLREIGIEKTWLRTPEHEAAPASAGIEPAIERVVVDPPAPVARPAPLARPEAQPLRPVVTSRPQAEEAADVSAAGNAGIDVARRVASQDLQQLEREVFACTACGLCQGRKHAVFGEGARPARWLVVGEAPGEQEDRRGLPFVGRSGQLLDAMLASVGMSRERDVFIANVIKCRPPGNRNPKPEEIAACSPYLMRQIDLIEPDRILVLGRFAAQTLLGTDATIGNLRGRRHTLKTEQGRDIPVVVSYHPAYLLRSPSEKARAWQDLQLALRDD